MDRITYLENKVKELEKRIVELEGKDLVGVEMHSSSTNIEKFAEKLVGKFDSLGIQNLVVIALKLKPKQTKSELKDLLLSWGAKSTIHGWFNGGNFKHRLLDTGFVKKDRKNDEGEELFSLTTGKGIPKAKKLFEDSAL